MLMLSRTYKAMSLNSPHRAQVKVMPARSAAQLTKNWAADVLSSFIHPTNETIAFYAINAVFGALASVWVAIPETTLSLLIFMAADMFSGLLVAAKRKEVNKQRSYAGIMRKAGTLIVVWIAYRVGGQLGAGDKVGVTVAIMFTADEAISILENCRKLGARVPDVLLDNLLRLRGRDSDQPRQRATGTDAIGRKLP